jgi:hypothetical protein
MPSKLSDARAHLLVVAGLVVAWIAAGTGPASGPITAADRELGPLASPPIPGMVNHDERRCAGCLKVAAKQAGSSPQSRE